MPIVKMYRTNIKSNEELKVLILLIGLLKYTHKIVGMLVTYVCFKLHFIFIEDYMDILN